MLQLFAVQCAINNYTATAFPRKLGKFLEFTVGLWNFGHIIRLAER